ncbi:MAG: DUF2330 domain-containing protein [Alphaproteobacteria bacterium]|nr:DUF2330 domain-containing protein [Alphaproteobacteria bacterium]
MHELRAAAALTLLLTSADALACGGFFCNRDPIDQSAEKIVFAIDDDGTVDVHVQVTYTGPASSFAWVVPAPDVPELFVAPEELFNVLDNVTRPNIRLSQTYLGQCTWGWDSFEADTYAIDSDWFEDSADSDTDAGGSTPHVTLVASQQLGPYDTVTLAADDADALVAWLNAHDYLVPAAAGPRLAPYVAHGGYFVALRLQKDRATGDIAPFGMRYHGTKAVIPLTLTGLAATPDMRLVPYVLGSARAIPTNYLHVVPNDAAIDWFRYGGNWDDVVRRAADEAGGHAFATDSAGPTTALRGSLWRAHQFDTAALAAMTDLRDFMDELLFRQGFTSSNVLLGLLRQYVPVPAAVTARGVSDTSFYNCVRCYPEWQTIAFDPAAFAADLERLIVEPRHRAEALFSAHPWVTRLTSSMSPDEMDLDPMFELDPSAPAVSRDRTATLEIDCQQGERYDDALRTLRLADGRDILLPSNNWLSDHGQSSSSFLADLTEPAAILIEDLGPEEEPEPVVDNTEPEREHADRFNAQTRALLGLDGGVIGGTGDPVDGDPTTSAPGGCGCSAAGAAPSGGLAVALAGLLLGLVRRRR